MCTGVWVISSARASAACSAGLNRPLVRNALTAAIFSSETPCRLLPAAFVSIQKGQPTSCARRRQTSDHRAAGKRPLFAGAAPSARLASRIGGQEAWIPGGMRGSPKGPGGLLQQGSYLRRSFICGLWLAVARVAPLPPFICACIRKCISGSRDSPDSPAARSAGEHLAISLYTDVERLARKVAHVRPAGSPALAHT